MGECQVNFSITPSDKVLIWLNLEIREFRENRAQSARKQFSHSLGYQQTLDAPRREVRLPHVSRHWRTEFQKSRDLGLVTARKRTSETRSLDVWCTASRWFTCCRSPALDQLMIGDLSQRLSRCKQKHIRRLIIATDERGQFTPQLA